MHFKCCDMIIRQKIQEHISVTQNLLQNIELLNKVEKAAQMMSQSLTDGGKIHFCGNGGSAADAQHLAAELSGRFYLDRKPLNAEALHCNSSYMTAVSNDFGFNTVYARLIEGSAKSGDVLVGISTSGNSENIILAFEQARKMGVHTVAMTGFDGGKLKEHAELLLNIPSSDTPRIQECHIMLGHILCEMIENTLFVDLTV